MNNFSMCKGYISGWGGGVGCGVLEFCNLRSYSVTKSKWHALSVMIDNAEERRYPACFCL